MTRIRMSKASGAGRGAAGRRKANGVNASPLRLGGLYSRRSLSSLRGSAAPPDAHAKEVRGDAAGLNP